MKERLAKAFAAVKGYLRRAKLIVTKFETTVHAVIVAAVGGGATSVYEQMKAAGHFTVNAEKLVEMKAHFIFGAVMAVAFWLKSAPAAKQPNQPQ